MKELLTSFQQRAPRSMLVVRVARHRVEATAFEWRDGAAVSTGHLTAELSTDLLGGDAELVGAEIRLLLDNAGLRPRRVVVLLPLAWAMTHATPVEGLTGDDLEAFLALEAERVFPYNPGDLAIGRCRTTTPDGRPVVTLLAVPQSTVDAVELVMRRARLSPTGVVVGAALLGDGAGTRLHLLAEDSSLCAIVTHDGAPVMARCLRDPVGADPAPAGMDDAARDLRIALRGLAGALGLQAVGTTILADAERARLYTEALAPVLPPVSHEEPADPGRALAARAAALAMAGNPLPADLLRPRLGRLQRSLQGMMRRGLLLRLVGGAAALLLLAVLVLVYRQHRAGSLEAEWAAMEAEVARVSALQDDLRAWRPWFDAGAPSLDLLLGLTEAFPAGGEVHARQLEIRGLQTVVCTGFANSSSEFLRLQERLRKAPGVSNLQVQQLRGESPVQFSIVFQWGRRPAREG
jgi:hypothetical protein